MDNVEGIYRYTISQKKKLEKLLRKELSVVLEKIAQDTVNKVKVYIKQYWYNRYSPEDYERTYSLYKSVKYEILDDNVIVYFDLNNADRKRFQNGSWGSYTNFKNKPSFTGEYWINMIQYIDTGFFPSGIGSETNPRVGDGIDFISKTERWLNKHLAEKVDNAISVILAKQKIL